MMVGDWVIGGVAAGVAAVFGYPTWRLALRSNRDDERRRREVEKMAEDEATAKRVARLMFGEVDLEAEPNPDHPTMIDILKEIRDSAADMSALVAVVAYHTMDGHGPPLPPWLSVPPVSRAHKTVEDRAKRP